MFSSRENAAKLSIAAVSLLILLKVVASILTGSISIRADAVHSAIDLVGVVVGYIGIRISGKPPDEQHAFGHGKAENIASAIIAGLIFVAAGAIVYEAVKRLIVGGAIELITVGIYVTVAAIAVNVIISWYALRIARSTDSLALDDLTGFSNILIDFFSRAENATLELKTKSNNIKSILGLKHNRRTVISWSLNPQSVIDSDEWQTNNLYQRLDAAKECCDAGYLVGFHFDPIIYSADWESPYRELINILFKRIDCKNIAWISLGTFRFMPKLKTIVEQRFSKSKILDEELIIGFDKKLRYGQPQRVKIYKKMLSWIKSYSGSVLVYLCMEPKEIWEETLGRCKF